MREIFEKQKLTQVRKQLLARALLAKRARDLPEVPDRVEPHARVVVPQVVDQDRHRDGGSPVSR